MEFCDVNSILIYSHIPDRYKTDGKDLYVEIKSDHNKYRVCYTVDGVQYRVYINEQNLQEINFVSQKSYCFINDKLMLKLKWQRDKQGYLFYLANNENGQWKISQHRLVYFYHNNFIPLDGYCIDHINRVKEDNTLDNLRLVTHKENANNINLQEKHEHTSAYNQYVVTDLNGNYVGEGYADVISKLIGISTGLINKYAKKSFVYNKQYKIYYKEEKKCQQ